MNEIVEFLKNNLFDIFLINNDVCRVQLPILYNSGDWVSIDISKDENNDFIITDGGFAFKNFDSLTLDTEINIINKCIKNFLKKLKYLIPIKIKQDDNGNIKIFIKGIKKDQLIGIIPIIANYSIEFSDMLIKESYKLLETNIKDKIEDKLKYIFKQDYSEIVKKNFEVIGSSFKKYQLSYCIDKKILLEPISNNFDSIAKVYTKYADIGKTNEFKRITILEKYNDIEGPNIELLKSVCESIQEVNNLKLA